MTCLVAGENYEEQLAPFQENNMGYCPEEFLDTYTYELEKDDDIEWLDFENEDEAKEHCKKVGIKFDPKNGHWSNSKARWDWYQVGGRWYGYFVKKADGYGKKGSKSWMDARPDTDDNRVDIVRKGDIDIDGVIKGAVQDGRGFLEIIKPYAFIKDGEFIERYSCPDEEYNKLFGQWWDSLSDDEIIVAIDYHM